MTRLLALLFIFVGQSATAAPNIKAKESKVDHVLVMVFDQMRPDYIERFDLKNFKRLIKISRNYPNAYVGHDSSITIVSHAVISTGLPPKDLPWADDVMWDKHGFIGKENLLYQTTALTKEQILTAMSKLNQEDLLPARLKKKLGKPVFSLGEKNYATIAMGSPAANSIVTMKKMDDGKCKPDGINVPDYISSNDRYSVDCKDKYGTEKSFYALDGNHFYPGKDPAHLGGDVWTADMALDVMNHEDWGGLFLTFGAIDKFGHLTGADDAEMPLSFTPPATLEEITKVADSQLGKILDALTEKKLLERTLIISTADHGGHSSQIYLGNGENSTIGNLVNRNEEKSPLPFWMKRLEDTGKVKLAFADTSIRLWLNDDTDAEEKVLKNLREVTGVTQIFKLESKDNIYHYTDIFKNLRPESKAHQKWAMLHDTELLNTMANDTAPNLVALLRDNVGFQKLGDHGGNQEMVQRIPFIVHNPGESHGSSKQAMRLVDVESIITKVLGLAPNSSKKQ